MLLVSPERLNNPGFRDEVLPRLAATCGLLVVDEAHCISDWGHDFRPDYRRIRTLLADLPDGHPGAGHHRHRQRAGHRRRRRAARRRRRWCCAARSTASRCASAWSGCKTAEQRLAWLADHLAEQPGVGHRLLPHRRRHPGGRRLPALAAATRSRRTPARPSPPSGCALEEDLLDGRVKALVATSALGMGFDATPRLRGQPRGARSRRSPTTSRSAAPAAAPTEADGGAAARDRGPRHLGLLRLARLPARGAGAPDPRGARRRRAAR